MRKSSCGLEFVNINKTSLTENYINVNTLSIIKCIKGWAIVTKNDTAYKLSKGVHYLVYENIHLPLIKCSDDFECIQCYVEISFLAELYPYLNSRFWKAVERSNPDSCKVKKGDILELAFEQLINIHKNNSFYHHREIALFQCLSYLYIHFNVLVKDSPMEFNPNNANSAIGNGIVDKFFLLCRQHFMKERRVEFYANELNITTRHLYNLIMKSQQLSPKAVINSFTIGTIKKLLTANSLSLQEIAIKLHFPDQSAMWQYFKRATGQSPLEYRKRNKANN